MKLYHNIVWGGGRVLFVLFGVRLLSIVWGS